MPKDKYFDGLLEGNERHRNWGGRTGHTNSKEVDGHLIPVDTYMTKYSSHLKRRDIYESHLKRRDIDEEVDESYEGFVL